MTKNKAYEILGIEADASVVEIKAAYAELSKKYHPEENPEEFQQIHEAYVTLTRLAPNRNRILRNINIRIDSAETFIDNSSLEKLEVQESFDFSDIENAKKADYERRLQSVIEQLNGATYADKKSNIYVDNFKLRKILNSQETEILYSDEFIEKLTIILKSTLVNNETLRIVRAYIRPWDPGMYVKRNALDRLNKVLVERNKYYFKKCMKESSNNLASYVCWAFMGIFLLLGMITDFMLVVKISIALFVMAGVMFFTYKVCKIWATKGVANFVASISGFIVLFIGIFLEVWKWVPELKAAKELYIHFINLWIAVIAGGLYRIMRSGK